ncbi:hypothetical protein [uncultured Helicobacter sp.]|uniref:hypothetical protein n=1 Tax=uncultured Helicobacter sp. TaxID=175537 RepID=UPI00375015A2
MRVYPFGHDGIIGGRLSLYMSSMFFLICALGGGYIYARIKHIRIYRILSTLCLIIIFLLPMLYRHIRAMSANTHHIQQTHTFIKQIATQLNPKACVLVYKASERAFGYYTQLDNLTIPQLYLILTSYLSNNFSKILLTAKSYGFLQVIFQKNLGRINLRI